MTFETPWRMPTWAAALVGDVPSNQRLVGACTYGSAEKMVRMREELPSGTRLRLIPSPGAGAALATARARGDHDILTLHVLDGSSGWDAKLHPASLVTSLTRGLEHEPRTLAALAHLRGSSSSLNAEELARLLGVCPRTLTRGLKTGGAVSMAMVLRADRLDRTTYLLVAGFSITEISTVLGYAEPSALCRMVKQVTGMTAHAWRAAVQRDRRLPERLSFGPRHQQPLMGARRAAPSDVVPSGPDSAAQPSSPAR